MPLDDKVQAKTEVAAIALTFEATVGDGRVLRMQSGIAADCSLDQLNALLDIVGTAIERQAAKGDIAKWEAEAEKHARMIERYERDMAEADQRSDEAVWAIEDQIKHLNAQASDLTQTAAQQHARSERRGDFELKGPALQKVRAAESEIAKKREELLRINGEKAVAHGQLDQNLRRAREEVAFLTAKIEAASAKL